MLDGAVKGSGIRVSDISFANLSRIAKSNFRIPSFASFVAFMGGPLLGILVFTAGFTGVLIIFFLGGLGLISFFFFLRLTGGFLAGAFFFFFSDRWVAMKVSLPSGKMNLKYT